jgi:hypothetical protein
VPKTHDRSKDVKRRPKKWPRLALALLVVPTFAMTLPSSGAVRQVDVVRLVATLEATGRHRWLPMSHAAWSTSRPEVRSVVATASNAGAVGQVVAQTVALPSTSVPTSGYLVSLIHHAFPPSAWHDAVAVAWCESKFRPLDIGYDSNGTHDRGLFQLNDGGTQQYLFKMLGLDPNNLDLAFNPVLNARAAALLFARDGWSQWSCASTLT